MNTWLTMSFIHTKNMTKFLTHASLLWTIVHCILLPAAGLDNGVALTPPMGWLSWERFGCNLDCSHWPDECISERLYLQQADLLVTDGYLSAGYRYVNVDDCWSEKERDETGNLVADKKRFPSGLKNLSQQLHDKGLLFGLYGDIGSKTCAGYPGFDGHFEQDAQQLANWQVDSIKVDVCNSNNTIYNITFPSLGQALNSTGRPILYNCQWPLNDAFSHHGENPDILNPAVKHVCNQWRNYYDVFDSWTSIRSIVDHWSRDSPSSPLVRAAGPGHWNDPDMLVTGNPGLSISEQQAQFCLWAIFASPLLISADLRTIPNESRDILLNKDVIAVNQDIMGRQGWCAQGCASNIRVYVRELLPTNGQPCPRGGSDSWAIVLANFNSIFREQLITFDPKRHLPTSNEKYNIFAVRDLLTQRDFSNFFVNFTAAVDESSVRMYKVTLKKITSIETSNLASF